MDESGIDMGFDLAALNDIDTNDQHGFGDDDFEQALSLLSTTTKDFMYYELKSRAPDTGSSSVFLVSIKACSGSGSGGSGVGFGGGVKYEALGKVEMGHVSKDVTARGCFSSVATPKSSDRKTRDLLCGFSLRNLETSASNISNSGGGVGVDSGSGGGTSGWVGLIEDNRKKNTKDQEGKR
ncbi:hypothetical protein M0804_011507 [Polistes exclamans]|nr:hypothetical protein M0804_011507 [Polistes exclamans]